LQEQAHTGLSNAFLKKVRDSLIAAIDTAYLGIKSKNIDASLIFCLVFDFFCFLILVFSFLVF
jgi:hypothetical protein